MSELPRYVEVKLVCCPFCGASDYRSHRTNQHGDGTSSRPATCRLCGGKFIIIAVWPDGVQNLPNFGKRKNRDDRVRATTNPSRAKARNRK